MEQLVDCDKEACVKACVKECEPMTTSASRMFIEDAAQREVSQSRNDFLPVRWVSLGTGRPTSSNRTHGLFIL